MNSVFPPVALPMRCVLYICKVHTDLNLSKEVLFYCQKILETALSVIHYKQLVQDELKRCIGSNSVKGVKTTKEDGSGGKIHKKMMNYTITVREQKESLNVAVCE